MDGRATVTAANIRKLLESCRASECAADHKVEGEPGLWLRVSAKGVGAWSLMYRPKGRTELCRYGLGRFPAVSLSDAREMARAWMGRISEGVDPRAVLKEQIEAERAEREKVKAEAEERAARLTVADAVERYVAAKKKNRSIYHTQAMLGANLIAMYGSKALADLTRADVLALHDAIVARDAPRQADNVLGQVRALLSWAKSRHLVTDNVAARFERSQKNGDGIRERKLTAAEVRILWLATDRPEARLSPSIRRIIKLAILLGQRAGEISGMRRAELTPDLMLWTIPASRMKAKREHILPLPPMARTIIREAMEETDGPLVLPGKAGKQFRSSSLAHAMSQLHSMLVPMADGERGRSVEGLPPFRDANGDLSPVHMHDLRRTLATGIQTLGVSIDVVKTILAHTDRGDVTKGHYAQSSLCDHAREALTRWQATVTQIVQGHDPFAQKAEDVAEMERRILGQHQVVSPAAPIPPNVVPLRAVG